MINAGDTVTHDIGDRRGVYLVPTEGTVRVNGIDVPSRAGVRVSDEPSVTIEAVDTAEIVLVNVAL